MNDPLRDYQPKTELGKKLLDLRRAFIESGGRLLSSEELDKELRRADVADWVMQK